MISPATTKLSKAAQHRLIAIRYDAVTRERRRERRRKHSAPAHIRISELERIFSHWYGTFLPDDAEGRHMLAAYADSICFTAGSVLEKLVGFIRARAPWALPEAEAIAEAAELASVWQDADEMANRIRLSLADRDLLKVGTIGAVEVTKRQRKALQKKKRRDRETARRRAKGAKPRAEYEAQSISRAKPWEALGISGRTWYRRRAKEAGVTSPCPPSIPSIGGHALLTTSPRSGRDALRAGPRGPRPCGLRQPERADEPGIYYGEEGSPGRQFSGGESHTGIAAQPVLYQAVA